MTAGRDEILARAAERTATRPEYLGWVLTRYMDVEALDWLAMARLLGTPTPFARVALCLRPRQERFAEDVTAIAERFGLDAAALARIVRHVDALCAMAGGDHEPSGEQGTLLAARTKERHDDRNEPSR